MPLCGQCKREVSDQGLQFQGVIYDRACFCCSECKVSLGANSKVGGFGLSVRR
jgi:hypothetical protein